MIYCQTNLHEIPQARYRRLAGPFAQSETQLFETIHSYLRSTGARVVVVAEPEGAMLWRLRSECETLEETEARLKKYKTQQS